MTVTAQSGKLKIFISWSGELSRNVAVLLRAWIPRFVQDTEPWMSDKDIEAGTFWHQSVTENLGRSTVGIIVVTPENREATWLNYEAGALAQRVIPMGGVVVPLLFNMSISDLVGPMKELQVKLFERDRFREVLDAINERVTSKVPEKTLDEEFDDKWPRVEKHVVQAIGATGSKPPQRRSNDDMVEEILETVREIRRTSIDRFAGAISDETIHRREVAAKKFAMDVFNSNLVDVLRVSVVTTMDGVMHIAVLTEHNPQDDSVKNSCDIIATAGPYQVNVTQVTQDELKAHDAYERLQRSTMDPKVDKGGE